MIEYSCQDRFSFFCEETRKLLSTLRIAIIGVGALGTHTSQLLVRLGARNLVLFDDDVIEATNLARQTLYTSDDVGKHKVIVAEQALKRITPANIIARNERFCSVEQLDSVDFVLDCTDTLEARLLINDACKEKGIPWVHAAVIEEFGQVMLITPQSVDYRTVFEKKNVENSCSEQGIIITAVAMTASLQVNLLLGYLSGSPSTNTLFRINTWQATIEHITISH